MLIKSTGLDRAKTASKNAVHEKAGATGELIVNKIACAWNEFEKMLKK